MHALAKNPGRPRDRIESHRDVARVEQAIPHAELLPAQGQDELLDVLLVDPVHAHELPQRVHVGIDRESAAEDLLPHPRAHLCERPQPHAHPRLAPR